MKSGHPGKVIIALLLIFTVLTPTIVKATHHHSAQDIHETCSQEDVHIHKDSIDFCDICLLSTTPIECSFYQADEIFAHFFQTKAVKTAYHFTFSSFTFSSKQLRGPPLFS